MMHIRAPFSGIFLLTVLVLAGCGTEPQADPSAARADAAPASNAATPPRGRKNMDNTPRGDAATAAVPTPEKVLYQITDVEGKGALTYEISNGSHIAWWTGLGGLNLQAQHVI